ncbi:unnamed protein product [Protopolystoma xenopodis]|uniref:Uncharacterized protein n=1 Tax=Protopolystoma xenopodis TaxID=117903 RepID=A0A3S5AQK3_9PLAT|nr:unnamed protein product [Protopolystoma xenopodis]
MSLNSALPEVHIMSWRRRKTASRIWNAWCSKTLPSSMPSLQRRASREPALGKSPNCANPCPTDSSVGICKYVYTSTFDCSEKIKILGVEASTLGRMVRFTGRHHVYDNEESTNKSQSDFTHSTGDSFHEIWPDRRGDGQSTLPRKGKSGSTSAFRTALGFGSREPVKAASQDLQPHGQHSQLAVDPTSARRRHYANLLRFLPGVYEDRGEILSKVIYQNFSFIGVVFFRNVKW